VGFSHLAQRIEYLVEVDEYLPLGHFRDIVHALARIVPNAGILVAEAREDWRYDLFEVAGDFLLCSQATCSNCIVSIYAQVPGLLKQQLVL
jgi:hypothetical protein